MTTNDREILIRSARRIAKLVKLDAPSSIVLNDFALLTKLIVGYARDDAIKQLDKLLEAKRKLREIQ